MKTYKFTDKPFEIYGIEVIDPANHNFWRLPEDETAKVSDFICGRAKTAGGGRFRFRTNTKNLKITAFVHANGPDPCIPVTGSAGSDVMCGIGINSVYLGVISPGCYDKTEFPLEVKLDGQMHQITVNMPRNSRVYDYEITVDDDAEVLAPIPYSIPGKICFYGSSITEGGCATRTGNAYTAAVSRWLDSDYVNYGFSGNAKGEDAMADIICKRQFSAFVYDYDYNSPDAAHLEQTHERFFKRVRAAHPDLPTIMMTRPDFDAEPEECAARREVIYRTYMNALAAGDKNVYFLDGEQFYGVLGREMCSVDNCHPNDLGFFRIAEKVYGLLSKILKKQ